MPRSDSSVPHPSKPRDCPYMFPGRDLRHHLGTFESFDGLMLIIAAIRGDKSGSGRSPDKTT
jgi:hypothetical protein